MKRPKRCDVLSLKHSRGTTSTSKTADDLCRQTAERSDRQRPDGKQAD